MTSTGGGVARRGSFSRIADRYDATRGGLERGKRIAALLAPRLGAGRILEIGVGTGVVATALRAGGADVFGIDLSEEMLARAAARGERKLVVADACQLPFPDNGFSGCYSVWVLHLVDIEVVLTEVWRVLAPGGRYVVIGSSYFEADDPVKRIVDRMMAGLRGRAPDHPETLAGLAARRGFAFRLERAAPRPTVVSPKAMREQIQTRALSQLWDQPEERWREHVEPALAALRELGDEPLPTTETQLIAVLSKPAQPARERR